MHPTHSLLKVDVSGLLLVKDLLQFDSLGRGVRTNPLCRSMMED